MPWLTPDTIPESGDCRSLSIPASSEWLAIVSGALTELTQSWNWQKYGDVTVDEAVAVMQAMIDDYYSGCAPCINQPGGIRIVRINQHGIPEQVSDAGEWEPTTGEYQIPPPDAREGGTEQDQNCLAAANCANIMMQLYENVTDSASSFLTYAEAVVAFLEACSLLIAVAAGVLGAGLIALEEGVFGIIFGTASFLTADLWDETFSAQITCLLVNCASNDAGVVTFDWDCFWVSLADQTNAFDLTSDQLRLYGQIMFMLQVIGGVDALNKMGGTTNITEYDCADCFELPPVTWTIYEGTIVFGDNLVNASENIWTCDAVYWPLTDLYYIALCASAQGFIPEDSFSYTTGLADVSVLVQGWSADDCATALNPGSFFDVNIKSFELIGNAPFSIQFSAVPL